MLTKIEIDGPKFIRHFISSFGKILCIEFVSDFLAIVFCATGTLEIWTLDINDSSVTPELIDFLSLENGNISSTLSRI